MRKKPVIGITGAYVNHNIYMEGVYVHHDYHKSVAANGGLPIILPFIHSELALEMLQLCDGIILSGGEDVDPQFYGQEPHLHLGYTLPERDKVEIAIAHYAIEHQIPILAICRGLQVLNAALGGTLIQDIPSCVKEPLQHFQSVERSRDSHWVTLDKDSRLFRILGDQKVRVNSLHHQSIDRIASDLRVVAKASDGVIEAVEHAGSSSYLIGVQWHPESMVSSNLLMKGLFSDFIDACNSGSTR
jgi:putative glutamine amidotransferase